MPYQPNLDLLQQLGYYGAGGKDPGQRDIDKINQLSGTIDKGLMDYLSIRKAKDDRLKAELERQKLQQENTPLVNIVGGQTPIQTQANVNQIMKQPIPAQDLISGRLDTTQQGLEDIGSSVKRGQNIYDKYGTANVEQAKNINSLTGSVWVNPNNPSQFSQSAIPGWYEAKQSQGLAAAAQSAKQEKQLTFAEQQQKRSQEFQNIQMQMREKMREEADARLLGRQELQQIRPSYNDLNNQLILGDKVKKGLEYAIQNGINVTGLLSTPVNKFKEVFGMMPEDQQKILTDLRLNFADFVRARGGTAFTETEKQVFSPIVPEEKVDEETNLYRINRMMDILNDKKNFYETNYPAVSKSVKPENFNKPISSPKEFASLGALQTAFKAGKITADEAKNYARQKGWAK